jgi:hypothetical protein
MASYHLEAILDAWNFLEARFFSRLDGSFTAVRRDLYCHSLSA